MSTTPCPPSSFGKKIISFLSPWKFPPLKKSISSLCIFWINVSSGWTQATLCHSCEATRLLIIIINNQSGRIHLHFLSFPWIFSKIPSQFIPVTFSFPKNTPKYLKPSLFQLKPPGSFKSPPLHLPTTSPPPSVHSQCLGTKPGS